MIVPGRAAHLEGEVIVCDDPWLLGLALLALLRGPRLLTVVGLALERLGEGWNFLKGVLGVGELPQDCQLALASLGEGLPVRPALIEQVPCF